MGRWHAAAVAAAGECVAASVDPRLESARLLAARHPGARPVPDLDGGLLGGDVDVVHLCTPLETHAELAERAIRSGHHVLVEKPLAQNQRITADLLQLAAAHGVVLCPVHQFLFQEGVRRVRLMLPMIGPLLHLDLVACSAGGLRGGEDRLERIALDILPHPLSLLARFLPTALSELPWHVSRPLPGELRASAHAHDVSAGILISMRGRPTTNTFRLIGERATAHVDLFHGFAVIETGRVSRARKVLHPFALSFQTLLSATGNLTRRAIRGEPAYPGLRELVRAFYAAARGVGPPPVTPREVLEVAAVRDLLSRDPIGDLSFAPTES